ncbi:MAG: hypothetical protein ACOYLH_10390 [Flavobacteriales bacterium]
MRINLERMARVDRYLMGEMNPNERTIFIEDMKHDNDLKQDHDFQQALITSMQLAQAKANIRKASRAYHFRKIFLNTLLALTGLAGISAVIFFATQKDEPTTISQQTTSSPQHIIASASTIQMSDTVIYASESTVKSPAMNTMPSVRERIETPSTPYFTSSFDSTANRPPLLTATDIYEDDKHFCSPKKVASQFFEIDIDRDTTIVTKGGSRINYHKGTLMTASGKVAKGKAFLEFKEFTSLENMILGGMSTTSNGEILQTGGMFYINAVTVNSTPLKIKPGKEITVDLPTNGGYDDMQYFTGVENNIETITPIIEESSMTEEAYFQQKKGTINWIDPRPLFDNNAYLGIVSDTTFVDGLKRRRKDGSVVEEDISFWEVLFPNRLNKRSRYFYEQIPVPSTKIYSTRNAGIASYTMSVLNFGWANCDRFMKDPKAIMATFKVNIIEDSLDSPYNVQLILPKEGIIIQGFETAKDQFNFGKDTFKLPNDAFYVILVSMEHGDQIYYSYAVGNVRSKNIVPILCKPATIKEYFDFVHQIGQLENIAS